MADKCYNVNSMRFSFLVVGLVLSLLCLNGGLLAYPSDLNDQIELVFNVLTGKYCHDLYDVSAAIYRDQANKYNADMTNLTSYEKAKKICEENRYVCSKENDNLLFRIGKIQNKQDGYKIAAVEFYTKSHKHWITTCNFLINTKDNNRGYPISFPQLSQNLKSCINNIDNKGCVVKVLTNAYLGLETIP